MRVDVAAAEEDWRAVESSRFVPRRPRRPDRAAAERGDARKARGLANRELGRQARALREAEHDDVIAGDAGRLDFLDECREHR
jgi:hypothetical protein